MEDGTEVLGIDLREDVVQALNGKLTHVVTADSTDEEVLRQLSVPDFERVVVSIGDDIQASILTVALLLQFDITTIWAKAVSDQHGAILERLGVPHVIYPETEMGRRVAHLVRGSMQDYIEVDPGFALVKTTPVKAIVGMPLAQSRVRGAYGVAVVAVRRPGTAWTNAAPETVLESDDTILVAGDTRKAERFSQLR